VSAHDLKNGQSGIGAHMHVRRRGTYSVCHSRGRKGWVAVERRFGRIPTTCQRFGSVLAPQSRHGLRLHLAARDGNWPILFRGVLPGALRCSATHRYACRIRRCYGSFCCRPSNNQAAPNLFSGTFQVVKYRLRFFFLGDGFLALARDEGAIKRGTDCTSTDDLVALVCQRGPRYEPLGGAPFRSRGHCQSNATKG
jgi:hypothetical protein